MLRYIPHVKEKYNVNGLPYVKYATIGFVPSQSIMDSNIGASDQIQSGIAKHVLDKPFNKADLVKIVTSSRNKSRSRGKGRNKRTWGEAAEGKDDDA